MKKRRPIKAAAQSVDVTADWIRMIAQKIDKYGIRVKVVEVLPKPTFDITIKQK